MNRTKIKELLAAGKPVTEVLVKGCVGTFRCKSIICIYINSLFNVNPLPSR